MKLYSRAEIIDVEDIDELHSLNNKGVFVGVNPIPGGTEICVYIYSGLILYHYLPNIKRLIIQEDDYIGDYAYLLEDLIIQYITDIIDFNTDVFDLVIGRIENTFRPYFDERNELFSRFHRLLTQPDIKSAHN